MCKKRSPILSWQIEELHVITSVLILRIRTQLVELMPFTALDFGGVIN